VKRSGENGRLNVAFYDRGTTISNLSQTFGISNLDNNLEVVGYAEMSAEHLTLTSHLIKFGFATHDSFAQSDKADFD